MKRFYFLVFFYLILFSCKKNDSQIKQPTQTLPPISKGFELTGTLEDFYPKKVYLNKLIENSIYQIDSSDVVNNNFTLKGSVTYPERIILTFENYSSTSIVIIENKHLKILIKSSEIHEPQITGSPLNNELFEYKTKSKQIFKKIDFLFPKFQKARLENDAIKLAEIGTEMEKIETEFTNYSFQFIEKHKKSFISAMILRDQLKSTTIDTLRIENTFNLLSAEVKNSPDSEIIASFLNLH